MPQHNGQTGFVLRIGKQTLVDDNLSAGHTEGIGLFVLDKIELPFEIVYLTGIAIVAQVGLYGMGEIAPYTLYHSRVLRICRTLG